MFKSKKELAIALASGKMFKESGGWICKFDPDLTQPFVCIKADTEWKPMVAVWDRYAEMVEVKPADTLPALLINTRVNVRQGPTYDFEPRYFKEFDSDGKMLCFIDGKTSFTSTDGGTITWELWVVVGGPFNGEKNF